MDARRCSSAVRIGCSLVLATAFFVTPAQADEPPSPIGPEIPADQLRDPKYLAEQIRAMWDITFGASSMRPDIRAQVAREAAAEAQALALHPDLVREREASYVGPLYDAEINTIDLMARQLPYVGPFAGHVATSAFETATSPVLLTTKTLEVLDAVKDKGIVDGLYSERDAIARIAADRFGESVLKVGINAVVPAGTSTLKKLASEGAAKITEFMARGLEGEGVKALVRAALSVRPLGTPTGTPGQTQPQVAGVQDKARQSGQQPTAQPNLGAPQGTGPGTSTQPVTNTQPATGGASRNGGGGGGGGGGGTTVVSPANPQLASGVSLSKRNVQPGDRIEGSFSVRNAGGQAWTIKALGIKVSGPSYVDFGWVSATINPGDSYSFSGAIPNAPGTTGSYNVEANWQDSGGTWHGLGGNSSFTVSQSGGGGSGGSQGPQPGQTVGLKSGSEIRTAPSDSATLTKRLTVGCWTVKITQVQNGWINIDRKAAGDPSGGTGWTHQSNIDGCAGN